MEILEKRGDVHNKTQENFGMRFPMNMKTGDEIDFYGYRYDGEYADYHWAHFVRKGFMCSPESQEAPLTAVLTKNLGEVLERKTVSLTELVHMAISSKTQGYKLSGFVVDADTPESIADVKKKLLASFAGASTNPDLSNCEFFVESGSFHSLIYKSNGDDIDEVYDTVVHDYLKKDKKIESVLEKNKSAEGM